MTILFTDYIELVAKDYKAKKAANNLSLRFAHPTPGQLKEECKVVCKERFERKDYKTLKTFFGQAEDVKSCLQAIDKCDIDKFRPILNFLKGKTNDPEPKNVELLAWLIDFTERPYEYGKNYNGASGPVHTEAVGEGKETEDIAAINGGTDKIVGAVRKNEILPAQAYNEEKEKSIVEPAKPAKLITSKGIILGVVILIILIAGVVSIWRKPQKSQVFAFNGQEACMFWTGDHFQRVSCSQKLGDTLVIALDTVRLNHFKKITQPDTITRNAIGNVWYVKVSGNVEFYTSDGYHPMHPDLRLRPITLYMINKYVKPGTQAE